MAKSTKPAKRNKSKPAKPDKPYDGFPLFPHATGRWCRKVRLADGRQKAHYFGRWGHNVGGTIVWVDDVDESARKALEQYNREWPYLKDGSTPPPVDVSNGCTLRDLCNAFLTSKQNKLDNDELCAGTFRGYYETCSVLIKHFGHDRRVDDLRPDDFEALRKELAVRLGVVTLRNEINRCRVIFKYAFDQRLISQPVSYGQSFAKPSAKMLRRSRNEAGPRMFEAAELLTILETLTTGKEIPTDEVDGRTGKPKTIKLKPDLQLKAMTLLGLNCGFGNTDVASLPRAAVDLDAGWIDFPRTKTEIPRRIPLWPETVDALRAALAVRPRTADGADADLCFITIQGNRWVRTKPKQSSDETRQFVKVDTVTARFAGVLKKLHINGRKGLGFYTLRHVFETVAGESKDQVAVNGIMGHVDHSMAGVYRERISDDRLQAVVDVVRAWLWPPVK